MEFLLPFLFKSPFFWGGLAGGVILFGIHARRREIERREEAFAEYEACLAAYLVDCAAAGVEPEYDVIDGLDGFATGGGAGFCDGGGYGD